MNERILPGRSNEAFAKLVAGMEQVFRECRERLEQPEVDAEKIKEEIQNAVHMPVVCLSVGGAFCKGSLTLGTGCRACQRCFDQLMQLATALTDSAACDYDHHGYCQTHSLDERPCPHESMNLIIQKYQGE